MAKVALLIGVSEYGSGLNPLPGAVRDAEAMQHVLQPLEMGGFDEVKLLANPNPPVMREAIETLFSGRTRNDLVLLFFSGHVVQDDSGKLYFATSITCKSPKAELVRVSAIPISFVHDFMNNSLCQHQVIILDCCLSHLPVEEMMANEDGTIDIKTQLIGEGRAILTSFTSTQNPYQWEGFSDHSVYTRYLVEGIRTGAADLDSDGWISLDELHEYASNKVQVAAPVVKPEFYPFENGHKIPLVKVLIDASKLKYRREAERWIKSGEISEAGRYTLDNLAASLRLNFEDYSVIEDEVLKPYQEYQEKLQRYKQEFAKVISNGNPLSTQEREALQGLQQSLGLRDEDVALIEERIVVKLANLSHSEDDTSEPVVRQSKFDKWVGRSNAGTRGYTEETNQQNQLSKLLSESDSKSELNSLPSTFSSVLPEEAPVPVVQQTNSAPDENSSSDLAGSQTKLSAISTFPNKFFLPIGIGGVFITLALAIGLSARRPIAPPLPPADREIAKTITKTSDNQPSPSPSGSPSPESKVCNVFVNGNLRSEPTGFRDNVVESLKASLSVTGKQTEEGWIEVKLPDSKLAWAYRDIIVNEEEMKDCLSKKGITIKTIEDIPPPSSFSPSNSSF